MSIRVLAIVLAAAPAAEAARGTVGNLTAFPEGVFGVWRPKPGVTPQAILGPLSYTFLNLHEGGFSALRHRKTGDVWFTVLMGQVFRVSGDQMQYCFGELGVLVEQSPFSVDAVGETNVSFCWRRGLRGMPTHTRGCAGCDCAKIEIALTDPDTLEFTFWMSPPVVHAHFTMIRSGKEPSMLAAVESTMAFPYEQCKFVPHYGPNLPGEPDLRNKTAWPQAASFEVAADVPRHDDPNIEKMLAGLPRGCASGLLRLAKNNDEFTRVLGEKAAAIEEDKLGHKKCHQLNGINHMFNAVAKRLDKTHATVVPDVRLQYIKPKHPCDPCDVSYSISAAIDEDEYIAVGFKGQSWEGKFPYPPEYARPCYFGMCVDGYDNFTTDRIALGYASASHGACVREVAMTGAVVGKPADVENPMLRDTSVERAGDRTVVRFTLSQHWLNTTVDGPFRVMWAIGSITGGDGCEADFGYHGLNKGLSPVDWLAILGSTPCKYSASEMGRQ